MRHSPLSDEDIAELEWLTVMAIRRAVEIDGMHWKEACNKVMPLHTLAITERDKIYRKARAKYGTPEEQERDDAL